MDLQGGHELRSMSGKAPLLPYVADLWHRRQFTMSLATGNLEAQYLETMLGNVWHILNPALSMVVYYVIFGVLLGTDRGLDNFIGFLGIGIFTFTFTQRTIIACGSSVSNNLGLIRSLQFPRAVLPLSAVIRELSSYAFSIAVMFGILLITGEGITVGWLLAPFVILLMTMFCAGLGMVVARMTDLVRDVSNLLPFLFRFVFYSSGVIFALPAFITPGVVERLGLGVTAAQVRHLFVLNPFFTYIELLRDTLMTTYSAEHVTDAWIAAIVIAPVTFALGLVYFRGGEGSYGRG